MTDCKDNALTVPVVVMTAVVKAVELEKLDPTIVKSIVRKPFELETLRAAIDSACNGERSADVS